jgi:hypothetical protein
MVPSRWVAWYYTMERFWTTIDFFSDPIAEETFVEKE